MAKKSVEVSFVQGKDGKRAAPSKSLTPKISPAGNKKRLGVGGKVGPY